MMRGYRLSIPVLDQAEASRSDLLIGAMVQFKHEPAMRSVLAGDNATNQFTDEK
jgi:hypothetical protein